MNEASEASMDQSAGGGGSGGESSGQSDQICRDFQRGVCSRGQNCKFSHPEGMGSEPKDQPMVCRDFQNGSCNRSTCKYMHVSNVEEKGFMRTGQIARPMNRGGQDSSIPICKDFMNNKCDRGQSCKFRHAQEDDVFGGGGFYNEPPRKRPRDGFESDYRHLMEENVSLRRRVSDLQKEVSDLRATNDILLEQNARYRRSGGSNGSTYGGGYGSGSSVVSYPSRDTYPPAISYNANAYSASKPTSGGVLQTGSGYDGYTKFE